MGIPQVLIILIYAMGLGINLARHGQPKTDTYSFGAALVSTGIVFALLWWGGFFG